MVYLYTDGSSTGRSDDIGGWGWLLVNEEGAVLGAGAGGDPKTTNNQMELEAAIRGLRACLRRNLHKTEKIELVSDSQYVLGLAQGIYSPSRNLQLAKEIRQLALQTGCSFRWVRGHSGDPWNERCDSLAKHGKHQAKVTDNDSIGVRQDL